MGLIFVFGSNTSGRHGKGAALTARKEHGAVYGLAEGLSGQSYALPTCGGDFQPLSLRLIQVYVGRFLDFTEFRKDLGFQVTRVGCGLAYYTDSDIAPMFRKASPRNVCFDEKWRSFLGAEHTYWGTF